MTTVESINDAPHVMVMWANAITTGQRVTECFADRDQALAAANDQPRAWAMWNNTRVTVYWHEAHNRSDARREAYAALGDHRHIWGIDCKPCLAISADRDDSERDVIAARDGAGDHELAAVTS